MRPRRRGRLLIRSAHACYLHTGISYRCFVNGNWCLLVRRTAPRRAGSSCYLYEIYRMVRRYNCAAITSQGNATVTFIFSCLQHDKRAATALPNQWYYWYQHRSARHATRFVSGRLCIPLPSYLPLSACDALKSQKV